LARLPTTNAKLRKGDVARVTAFAIERAGEGADEVVDLIVSNIEQPFAFTSANPDRKKTKMTTEKTTTRERRRNRKRTKIHPHPS
jgi:U2-associated protein SR140